MRGLPKKPNVELPQAILRSSYDYLRVAMKVTSSIGLLAAGAALAGAATLFLGLSVAAAQTGWGQIQMDNRTAVTLDLYVDGNYGCRALSNLACTTQARAGYHDLEARGPNGRRVTDSVTLNAGRTYTLVVGEER